MRLAAIDLGTVTSRLLVADVCDNKINELERRIQITHLGEALNETGRIGKDAIERELSACSDFLATIKEVERRDGKSVERVIAIATSAMRDADNREEACSALLKAGIEIEVIDGKREAELTFLGAVCALEADSFAKAGELMVVDVGGGSTELVRGFGGREGRVPQIIEAGSFDIGSRRISDRFLISDPPLEAEISKAKGWIETEVGEFFTSLVQPPKALIAVAGTATTVVTVRDEMSDYDPWKVHGATVSDSELDRVFNKLAQLRLKERMQCTGLEPARASVILGGLLVLKAVLAFSGLRSFIVSEMDILHGLILSAAR